MDSKAPSPIDRLPVVNPEVVFQPVQDGAVLLSTKDETYYGLNSTGARMWALLSPPVTTFPELLECLREEYPEVDEAILERDLVELLNDLRRHDLVLDRDDPRNGMPRSR